MRRGGTKRAAGLSALVLLLSACVPILAPVTVEPSTSVEDVELPPDAAYLDGEVYVVGAANVPDLRDSGLLGEAVALDPQLVPVGLSHNGELALSRPGELQILDLRGRGSSTVDVGRTAGEPAPAQAFEAFVAPDVVVWTEVERDSEGDLAHLWLAPRDGDGGARRVDTISIEFPEGFLAPRLRPIVVADRVYWNGIFSERDPGPALRQAPTDQSLPGTVLLSGALEPQVDRCAGPDELAFYYSEAGSTNVAPQLRRRVVGLEGAVVSNVEVYADDILDSQTFRSGGACGGHAAVLRQDQRGEPERTSVTWVEISQGARNVTYVWPDGAQAWIDALAVAEDYVTWLVYEGYEHAPTRYVHLVGRGELFRLQNAATQVAALVSDSHVVWSEVADGRAQWFAAPLVLSGVPSVPV